MLLPGEGAKEVGGLHEGSAVSERYCFFKGRVALFAILKAMGITAGDEVILPGFTCVVVPNAIKYLGAKPVYVDIDPETLNIDPQKIGEKITGRTKAVIAQHTFGMPADMDKISEIAKGNNLYIIEDSCHSIGSRYKGREVGSFGDAAFFSSQWSKPVTTGLGGWAVIRNQSVNDNMAAIYREFPPPAARDASLLWLEYLLYSVLFRPALFWFAQSAYRKLSGTGIIPGSSSGEELEGGMPRTYTRRMSLWQQDLLRNKLAGKDDDIRHRKRIASIYDETLLHRRIFRDRSFGDYDPVLLRYPVFVDDKNKVLLEAKKRRIELGDWFVSPVHPIMEGWESVHYRKGMCPEAERICDHIINLPTHGRIGEEEAGRIAGFISNM